MLQIRGMAKEYVFFSSHYETTMRSKTNILKVAVRFCSATVSLPMPKKSVFESSFLYVLICALRSLGKMQLQVLQISVCRMFAKVEGK